MISNQIWIFLWIILQDCACTNSFKSEISPNLLVILTDDQQHSGASFNDNTVIQTPALKRLATQSIRCTNTKVVFSVWSLSCAAILTGCYGSANGILELNSQLKLCEKTIAEYL